MIYRFDELRSKPIISGHLAMGRADNGRETIEINSRYFTRNGVPVIGVMGEMHFARIPREEWSDRLRKMKAGGVTVVASYLFWIYHEEVQGSFDFSGNLDVREFVREAERAGLKTVIRIGPWAHGECRHGGFPDWLTAKGLKLRSNDPEYMKYVRSWYEAIYEQLKGMFHKDGGSIIGIQFDNELVNAPEHILALKRLALEIGFEAPVYTATGWNSKYGAKLPIDEVVPVFGAYADAPWAKGTDRRPPSPQYLFDPRRNDALVGNDIIGENDTGEDGWRLPYERYPFALCELGSGIQSTYQRRTVISDTDAYALSLVKLGCGNNLIGYYMYAGGTNRIGALSTLQETRASGSPNDYTVLNYDFHTAITEYGEVNPRYGMLNMLHLFVRDFGEILAPMEFVQAKEPVTEPNNAEALRYCMRTDGKGAFIFVNHHQRYLSLKDIYGAEFEAAGQKLPPIDVIGDVSFFIPVEIEIGGLKLKYALAQPLCRSKNRFFFAQIPGNKAKFKFAGMDEFELLPSKWVSENGKNRFDLKSELIKSASGEEIELCLLTMEDAQYLRRLQISGQAQTEELLLGYKCNLYDNGCELTTVEGGEFEYVGLSGKAAEAGTKFAARTKNEGERTSPSTVTRDLYREKAQRISVSELAKLLKYTGNIAGEIIDGLHIPQNGELYCSRISTDAPEGFIEINDECDTEMIIADNEPVADKFYDRLAWRVPARLIYGKEAYLITTPLRSDVFMDEL